MSSPAPSQSNGYLWPLDAKINKENLDNVTGDIHQRLSSLETSTEINSDTLENLATELVEGTYNNTVAPQIQQASEELQTLRDEVDAAEDVLQALVQGGVNADSVSISSINNLVAEDAQAAFAELVSSLSGKLDNFTGAWIKSSDGVNRFHFGTNGPTYINAVGGHGYNFLVSNNLVTQAVFKPDDQGTYLQLCGDTALEGSAQIQFCTDYTRTKVNWSIHDNVANSLHFYGWTGANGTGNYEQQFFVHQQGTLWTRSYGYLHEKFIDRNEDQTRHGSSAEIITDWNAAVLAGRYMGNAAANDPHQLGTPGALTGWYLGRVETHNTAWVTQEVWLFTSSVETNGYRYRRHMLGGVWQNWFKVPSSEFEIKELGPKKFEYAITSGIASGAAWSAAHGLGSIPDVVSVSLRFKVAYGGYLVGEELEVNPHLNTTYDYAKGFAITKTPSMLNIRLGTNPNPVDILDTAGNIHTAIGGATLAANCDIIIRAVKY